MISPTILTRRSVYPNQYTATALEASDIHDLIESARWAPTHRKTEPWRFTIFHTVQSRQELADYLGDRYKEIAGENYLERKEKKTRKKPLQSGAVIAIIMQRDPAQSIPEWEEIAATSMAVQNMWLTATDKGLGAYWSSPITITEGAEAFLGLTEGQRCLGLFYIGHWDAVQIPAERRSIQDISTWR